MLTALDFGAFQVSYLKNRDVMFELNSRIRFVVNVNRLNEVLGPIAIQVRRSDLEKETCRRYNKASGSESRIIFY